MIPALLRRVVGSGVARNALSLYAVQGATLILPLITLPYLARVLRPDGWGLVVFSQAFAIWLSLLLHYGFAFSATRRVAQTRADADEVERVVAGVQAAKLLLLGAVAAAAAAAALFVPTFRAHPEYLALALWLALAQGFSPLWYFQGIERMGGAAAIDVAGRIVSTAGVFVFVRGSDDGWIVLALQAAASTVAVGLTTRWMYRQVAWLRPSPSRGLAVLRMDWQLFVFCSAASVYSTANAFLVGLLSTPETVSFYGAGDRVTRAVISLIGPISQALYPRVNHLIMRDVARAATLVRASLLPLVALGLAMMAGLYLGAPAIVALLFGPGYEPVVPVIRVLSVLPPLLALGTVLGVQWVLPLGMERVYNRFVLTAGAVNIVLAIVLVPRMGALGMACAAVIAEALVECGLVILALGSARGLLRQQVATDARPVH